MTRALGYAPPVDGEIELVILAGGLGERFGGDKALAGLGPRGELLLEFSLFDAKAAGVERVHLVVPPGGEARFGAELRERVRGPHLNFVEQAPEQPYAGLDTPGRERPWGTAHAAAIASACASGPCVVVNADDWYGPRAIRDLAAADLGDADAALVTWPLAATLSEHGPVNRGLCRVEDETLSSIRECVGIEREGEVIRGQLGPESIRLEPDTPISLNCWLLGPRAQTWLETSTRTFVETHRTDPRIEAQLPTLLMAGIEAVGLRVRTVARGQVWAGVTFRADAERVRQLLREACEAGELPNPLWS